MNVGADGRVQSICHKLISEVSLSCVESGIALWSILLRRELHCIASESVPKCTCIPLFECFQFQKLQPSHLPFNFKSCSVFNRTKVYSFPSSVGSSL